MCEMTPEQLVAELAQGSSVFQRMRMDFDGNRIRYLINGESGLWKTFSVVEGDPAGELAKVKAAVEEHWKQKADDRCHFDDDELYQRVGLPVVDRHVGDRGAMLANCQRYIDRRCEGGKWPSYFELEEVIKAQRALIAAQNDRVEAQVNLVAAMQKRIDAQEASLKSKDMLIASLDKKKPAEEMKS